MKLRKAEEILKEAADKNVHSSQMVQWMLEAIRTAQREAIEKCAVEAAEYCSDKWPDYTAMENTILKLKEQIQ